MEQRSQTSYNISNTENTIWLYGVIKRGEKKHWQNCVFLVLWTLFFHVLKHKKEANGAILSWSDFFRQYTLHTTLSVNFFEHHFYSINVLFSCGSGWGLSGDCWAFAWEGSRCDQGMLSPYSRGSRQWTYSGKRCLENIPLCIFRSFSKFSL